MNRKKTSLMLIRLSLILFACIWTDGGCSSNQLDPNYYYTYTLVAQSTQIQGLTQTAQAQPIIVVVTATPDPALATATTNPAANVVPASTATTGAVTVTVSRNTNCRQGPGQGFDEVYALTPGVTAEVVAKNTFTNYWIIKIPDGSGRTCWLWGQYATVSGDTSTIADVTTPTAKAGSGGSGSGSAPGAPNAATFTNTSLNCVDVGGGDYEYQIGLDWADNSNNETHFNLYTSTSDKFKVDANKKFFDLDITLPAGTGFFITIKAANDAGESAPDQAGFECP
jgi:uncharacterized protein YgiM (DUF1202 family)